MTTIEIPAINWNKEIPSSFSEMSQDDYLLFVRLYLKLLDGEITYQHLKTEMVMQFLGIRHNKYRYAMLPADDQERIEENIYMISEHVGFLFNEVETDGKINLQVNYSWTKNFLPRYRNFTGFADFLSDLTFQEYKDAHVAAQEFTQSSDHFDLNRFVAILYRRYGFYCRCFGKKAYDPDKIEGSFGHVAAWPFYIKYAILLNFLACEKYLREGTFRIDGQDISFAILFKSDDDDTDGEHAGLTGLLYNLAETGVFGNVKETARQNLFDVLFRLWQILTEANARKPKKQTN
jgi:hypothetical protein